MFTKNIINKDLNLYLKPEYLKTSRKSDYMPMEYNGSCDEYPGNPGDLSNVTNSNTLLFN